MCKLGKCTIKTRKYGTIEIESLFKKDSKYCTFLYYNSIPFASDLVCLSNKYINYCLFTQEKTKDELETEFSSILGAEFYNIFKSNLIF